MTMKLKSLLAGVSLAAVSATASAVPMPAFSTTWTDVHVQTGSQLVNTGITKSWTHDLTDNGYDVLTDVIDSFTIYLHLKDDSNAANDNGSDKEEYAKISFNGMTANTPEIGRTWMWSGFNASATGIWQFLSDTGKMSMSLTASQGDFLFDKSMLTALGRENVRAVPEPGILALLGLGFAGLAFTRRRFR